MKNITFGRGGVHPPQMKITSGKPIVDIDLPRRVELLLAQSLGREPKPIVKAGDHVSRYDLVAEAQGPISANLHTPISGTVKSVGLADATDGHQRNAIVIEASDDDHVADLQSIADARPVREPETVSGDEIIDIVRRAGIVGMGGATFPAAVKLSPQTPPDVLLINGAECEPYLTCDEAIMRDLAPEIITGARLMARALRTNRIIVGIEDNKPVAIDRMRKAARNFPEVEIVAMTTRYPQGGEKMLTKTLTGREIASGQLPASAGVAIQNVATALAVFHAVVWNIPLVERVLTVSGRDVVKAGNYRAVIGTPVADIVAAAGGLPESTVRIVNGGPMMGRSMAAVDGATTKGLSGLLMLSASEVDNRQLQPCVRCGRCADACPMGLQPFLLARLAELRLSERLQAAHVMDCMECGCCTYSCIAARPVADFIRLGKIVVRNSKA